MIHESNGFNNMMEPQIKSNSIFMSQDTYEMTIDNAYSLGYTKGSIDTGYKIYSNNGTTYTKAQLKSYGFGCVLGTLAVICGIKIISSLIKEQDLKKKEKEIDDDFMIFRKIFDEKKEDKKEDLFD